MHIREVEEKLFQGALPARCSGVFRGVRQVFDFCDSRGDEERRQLTCSVPEEECGNVTVLSSEPDGRRMSYRLCQSEWGDSAGVITCAGRPMRLAVKSADG